MARPDLEAPVLPLLLSLAPTPAVPLTNGYYRFPAIHGDTVLFEAEGDLWRVPLAGGTASRLTTHHGEESQPAISPDGQSVAFLAQYDGPSEVYVMPIDGGLPRRLTWEGGHTSVAGWTPDGRVLYATEGASTYPTRALFAVDPSTRARAPIPLWQAAAGAYDPTGHTLWFVRQAFQGSHTKRYQGGTAQQIWRWDGGDTEAKLLTGDWDGTSAAPMVHDGRVYFVSDRDGTQNLWSMNGEGGDKRQLTHAAGFDVTSPSLDGDHIVYQLGADLHVYDIGSGQDRLLPVTLASDFDQLRPEPVDKPMDFLSAAHVAPDGESVVLTARGRVFVAPHRGRFVEVSHDDGVRYRDARFLDATHLVALSDATGEVELATLPANGVGAPVPLTADGTVLRWEAIPSPDGKRIAHDDKNQRLWVTEVATKKTTQIDASKVDRIQDLAWSPDGRWLAFVEVAPNLISRIRIWDSSTSTLTDATTDRFDSTDPVFSPDGKWLYFLSDRHLESWTDGPWGPMQPEPFFGDKTEIYALALTPEARFPFLPDDELHPDKDKDKDKDDDDDKTEKKHKKKHHDDGEVKVEITTTGLAGRLYRVPVDPGNYSELYVSDDALFWLSTGEGPDAKADVMAAPIRSHEVEAKPVALDVKSFELSADGTRLFLQKKDELDLVDAPEADDLKDPVDLDKATVDLSDWHLVVVPALEWRQMFVEAWRLERDYFYDTGMHGVDWKANLAKYLPLVDRVRSRAELADLIGQMVSELSALHTFVYGGDLQSTDRTLETSSLGAAFVRDPLGWKVAHIYASDPDRPDQASPLARPETAVAEGEIITAIDGRSTAAVDDLGELLLNRADHQVLLHVRSASGKERDTVAVPMSAEDASNLRYGEWELSRRQRVESEGKGQIGYVHLRAMDTEDWSDFARGYFPVFNRAGLIIDVRGNRGGDIDSWILERLLRKSWFFWTQRVGSSPTWNMQYAFRGHVAVLCDPDTSSDGEAFSEGIRRLGIGKVFGTRTWGGEIWLSMDNFLEDGGIATAAEFGVYGPEGAWLIEGHGVDPDQVVDTPPHAGYLGQDPPLEAAIQYLQQEIVAHPVVQPDPPPYPNKAYKGPAK